MTVDLASAKKIIKAARRRLLARDNVVATGIGFKITNEKKTSELSIICSVTEKLPESQLSKKALIPKTVDHIPTDVIETGSIRAFPARTDRWRPAPGGVSIGHHAITAGTLGCLVKKDNRIYILSNNHVLANSNNAATGDPILQPGPYDGGKWPDDHIADLSEFVPIVFTESDPPGDCVLARWIAAVWNGIAKGVGSRSRLRAITLQAEENLVDAAIARPLHDDDVSLEILEIGIIQALSQGELGMAVQKSGRTTGLTTGEILQVDVTVDVEYDAGQIARFTDQLLAGAMSQGGDSGSAVLTDDKKLAGLLFAGSATTTIINRIENVFTALGLSL